MLARILGSELGSRGVESEYIRTVEHSILPGVTSDEGNGDGWPPLRRKILSAEILVLASPTWVGRMSSEAQRVLERLNGLFREEDEQGRPPAYNHVAGFLATGNSDGAKHVIGEMIAACSEIGFSIPGQSWAYFNHGSAAGPEMVKSAAAKLKRSRWMAAVAASNLVAAAEAIKAKPFPAPPKSK